MITKKNPSFKKISALAAVLFGGAFLSLGLQGIISVAGPSQNLQASVRGAGTNAEEVHAPRDPFQNIALEAHAAYVLDLVSGKVLFSRNEEEKLPLASVTKLMTAFVAREHAREGSIATLTKDDLSAEGDSGLRVGEHWKLSNLLDVMLLVSSNDAAHAIASFVGAEGKSADDQPASRARFVQMMNEQAKTLGFSAMEFFNESGLDVDETTNGGYGSAHEVALLMMNLWRKYPETLEITTHKDARIYSQDGGAHILPNTDEAIGHFPGLIGSKTGYTKLAGGNLAIVFDRGVGSPVVAVVLGSGYKERFADMQRLTDATLKVLGR